MRKHLLTFAATLLATVSAFAWETTLVDGAVELDGYSLYKSYDFIAMTVNGESFDSNADGVLTVATTDAGFKIGGWAAYQVENTGMENWFIPLAATSNGFNLRANMGLYVYGSGSRWFAIDGMGAGQIIVIQGGTADSNREYTITDVASGNEGAANFTNISDDIHNAQIEANGEADNYMYLQMDGDGRAEFVIGRANCIQALQIFIDATAKEVVTAPQLSLLAVDGSARKIAFKPGESTFGNDVQVYYTTDGEEPLYLEEDIDYVLRYDTIPGEDYPDDPEDYDLEPVYGYTAQNIEGAWGDWYFDPEGEGYIEIDQSDDEDGDGIVTVKARCIAETGAYSELVSVDYSIGDIVLNAPTLSLSGMDGKNRSYQIGWTSNLLCKEDFVLSAEIDGREWGEVFVGDVLMAESSMKVTVSADGYEDGVVELDELEAEGINYYRKNAAAAAAGKHDWEYRSDYVDSITLMKVTGEWVVEGYYFTPEGDSIYAVGHENVPVDAIATVWDNCGWTYDSGRSRSWLDIVVGDTIFAEDGVTVDTIQAAYVEDRAGLFGQGIQFTNALNNTGSGANPSGGFAFYTTNIGLYFLRAGSFTIPEVTYGEYVHCHLGAGGSNWVDREWDELEMPAAEKGYSKNIKAGYFVQYIDIYTTDVLPEYDGIEQTTVVPATFNVIYDLTGRRLDAIPEQGLYILNGKKFLAR